MANETADWSQIPPDLLLSITSNLKLYIDYVRVRAVCINWQLYLPPTPPPNPPCQLPWLLLPPPPTTTTTTTTTLRRSFYNIISEKVHFLNLPEASYPRRICGSSHGWLTLVGETPDIFLLNPVTKAKVFLSPLSPLPNVVDFSFSNVGREYSIRDSSSGSAFAVDLRHMRDVFIRKVIISSSPGNGSDFIALGIITCNMNATSELVFCKKGGRCWKSVPVSGFFAEDVIYCELEGLFYAVNKVGDVAIIDLISCGDDDVPKVEIIQSVNAIEGDLRYLVKCRGELLLVSRSLGGEANLVTYCEVYGTVEFIVFKFREAGEKGWVNWDMVKDLGDWVVFLGESSSLALSASDFPGCKGNCIYFTDDHSKANDVGVFDLGRDRIQPLPCCPQDLNLPLQWAPPLWITLNPC